MPFPAASAPSEKKFKKGRGSLPKGTYLLPAFLINAPAILHQGCASLRESCGQIRRSGHQTEAPTPPLQLSLTGWLLWNEAEATLCHKRLPHRLSAAAGCMSMRDQTQRAWCEEENSFSGRATERLKACPIPYETLSKSRFLQVNAQVKMFWNLVRICP